MLDYSDYIETNLFHSKLRQDVLPRERGSKQTFVRELFIGCFAPTGSSRPVRLAGNAVQIFTSGGMFDVVSSQDDSTRLRANKALYSLCGR